MMDPRLSTMQSIGQISTQIHNVELPSGESQVTSGLAYPSHGEGMAGSSDATVIEPHNKQSLVCGSDIPCLTDTRNEG